MNLQAFQALATTPVTEHHSKAEIGFEGDVKLTRCHERRGHKGNFYILDWEVLNTNLPQSMPVGFRFGQVTPLDGPQFATRTLPLLVAIGFTAYGFDCDDKETPERAQFQQQHLSGLWAHAFASPEQNHMVNRPLRMKVRGEEGSGQYAGRIFPRYSYFLATGQVAAAPPPAPAAPPAYAAPAAPAAPPAYAAPAAPAAPPAYAAPAAPAAPPAYATPAAPAAPAAPGRIDRGFAPPVPPPGWLLPQG